LPGGGQINVSTVVSAHETADVKIGDVVMFDVGAKRWDFREDNQGFSIIDDFDVLAVGTDSDD
jgi:co-chaperonin GroES (HSP10)